MNTYLSQWCQVQGLSLAKLSEKTEIPIDSLQSIQEGIMDPPLSMLNRISEGLNIPIAWLHYAPQTILRLWNDHEEEDPTLPEHTSTDPLFERIFQVSREHQEVLTLLTNLIHHGDSKLIRAAQVNLQRLFKQVRKTSLPWGSRPPGHFEPPSD